MRGHAVPGVAWAGDRGSVRHKWHAFREIQGRQVVGLDESANAQLVANDDGGGFAFHWRRLVPGARVRETRKGKEPHTRFNRCGDVVIEIAVVGGPDCIVVAREVECEGSLRDMAHCHHFLLDDEGRVGSQGMEPRIGNGSHAGEEHIVIFFGCWESLAVRVHCGMVFDVLADRAAAANISAVVGCRFLAQRPRRTVGVGIESVIRRPGKHQRLVRGVRPHTAGRLQGKGQSDWALHGEAAHSSETGSHRGRVARVAWEESGGPHPLRETWN